MVDIDGEMASTVPERTEDVGCPFCSYCFEATVCAVAQTHSSPPSSASQLLMLQATGTGMFSFYGLSEPRGTPVLLNVYPRIGSLHMQLEEFTLVSSTGATCVSKNSRAVGLAAHSLPMGLAADGNSSFPFWFSAHIDSN